jgi:hypothetical protein
MFILTTKHFLLLMKALTIAQNFLSWLKTKDDLINVKNSFGIKNITQQNDKDIQWWTGNFDTYIFYDYFPYKVVIYKQCSHIQYQYNFQCRKNT